MRVSDIVSSLGLAVYPIIGMGLFLSVFCGVVARVLSRRMKTELDVASLLPLADDADPAIRSSREALP